MSQFISRPSVCCWYVLCRANWGIRRCS